MLNNIIFLCMFQTLDQKFAKLKQDQEFLNVKVQTTIQSNPMGKSCLRPHQAMV